MRNPSRTASTAAALMIGLTLVTIVAVLAQGLKSEFESAVSAEFHADYALTSEDGFTPTSVDSADALRKSGIATTVAGVRAGNGRAFGKTNAVTGVEPSISKVLRLEWTEGSDASLEGLGANGAILTKGYAKDHDLTVGSTFQLETPGGKTLDLKVKAITDPPSGGGALGSITISSEAFDSVYTNPQNVFTFVEHARRRDAREHGEARERARHASRTRRSRPSSSSSPTRRRRSIASCSCSTSCSRSRSSSASSGS